MADDDLGDAIRQFWRELAKARIYPPDRLITGAVFVVGLIVGLTSGLGLLSPVYALVLAILAVALAWVIDALARAKS